MTWMVTGGAGYIGAHVVRAFEKAGIPAVVIDDLSSGHREFVGAQTPFVEGSILDTDLVILGGTLAGLLPAVGPALKAELASLTTLTSRHPVPVVASGLGEDSALVGAAEIAFESLLADPLDVSPLAASC